MRVRTDEQLMARYAGGDLQAFGDLYARYERRLYNYLLRLSGERHTAADLVQDTFLRLHRERGRYRTGASFRPWVYTIATNLWRDERRRRVTSARALEREAPDPAGSLPEIIDLSGDPERQVEAARMLLTLRVALDAIPQNQREAIVLSRYEGLTHEEIGQVLGVSAGAVKLRVFRGLSRLREKLSAWMEE
ncbi:MAG: RNA polymerase sigma factor [Deltaproteobacteria bacterium]|nr:RNA polymerase sigma factor [Deltaproteobacteria bacterium]